MTPDVLSSPAVALLLRLEHDGFALAAADGRLLVKPADRLSETDREALREHKAALLTLLRIVDEGVQHRRAVFASKLAEGGLAVLPDLVLTPGIAPVAGRCVSCGDGLEAPRAGKCWRCCLAWRLAVGVPIPADLELALDETRRVA